MPFSPKRFEDYMADMQAIQEDVSDPVFLDMVREEVFDLLASGAVDPSQIDELLDDFSIVFDREFTIFEDGIRDGYNRVLSLVNQRYSDLGEDMSTEMRLMRDVEKTNTLQLGEYKQETIDAIKEKIREGLLSDTPRSEIEDAIAAIDSRAAHYAKTLAGTHLMRYGNISRYGKAIQAGVTVFVYLGVLRDTTRNFCRAALGNRYHIDDILKFRNGNLEPVIENSGGWNCIHGWEPDPFALEEEVTRGEMIEVQGSPGSLIILAE